MDIRKMVDVTNHESIDAHISMERAYQNYLMRRGKRHMTKADQKAARRSQQRAQQLEQAGRDWAYSDGLRDLKYGGH